MFWLGLTIQRHLSRSKGLEMSRKMIFPAAVALLGLLVGGGAVECAHRSYDQRSKEMFARRERCKSLADQYVRQNTTSDTTLFLQRADYSASSNSCFAAAERFTNYRTASYQEWELVDLLSGEVTSIGSCSEQRDCGNGRDIHFLNRLDVVFKSAIDGTIPPKDTPNR